MNDYNPDIIVGNDAGEIYKLDAPYTLYAREWIAKDSLYIPCEVIVESHTHDGIPHEVFYVGERIEVRNRYGKLFFSRKIDPCIDSPRTIDQTYTAQGDKGATTLRFEMIGTGGFIALTILKNGVPVCDEIHFDLNEIEGLKFAVMNADGDMEFLND